MAIGFYLLMVFSVFSSMIEALFFPNNLYAYQTQMKQRFEANLWLLIVPLVVAPVFEEWLFRGVILTRLTKKCSFEMSNAVTAFLFAMAHLNWFLLPYFLNGLIYGWVYKKSGKLFSVMMMHSMYNLMAILVAMTGIAK